MNRFLESVSETLAKRGFILCTFGKGDQQSGSEPFERGAGTAIDRDEAAEATRKAYAEAHCNDWVKEYGIAGRFRTRDLAVNIFSRLVGPAPEDSVSFVLLWLDEEVADPVKDLGRMVRTAAEGLGFHTVDLGTLYRESLSLDEFKSAVAPTMIKACDARAPQALASPFRGDARAPQALASPLEGDARAPQALASPFRGDARTPQVLASPLEGDARAPQALASPAKGDARTPQVLASPVESDDTSSTDPVKNDEYKKRPTPGAAEQSESGAASGRTIPDELRERLEGENGRTGAEQFMKGLERSLAEEPAEEDTLAVMF